MTTYAPFFAAFTLLLASQVVAQEVKLVGDETKLARVKADPTAWIGKRITLTGGAQVSDYYNFGYRDAEESHYSIEFLEVIADFSAGEELPFDEQCYVYLRRDWPKCKEVIDRIIAASPKYKTMRVIVTLLPFESGDLRWRQLELIDAQFLGENGKWEPWLVADAIKQEAARRLAAERAAMEKKKASDEERKQRQAERDRLRWRTWTSAKGGYKTEAKIVYIVGDAVVLEKKGGQRIKVPISSLSEADRSFIESGEWNKPASK